MNTNIRNEIAEDGKITGTLIPVGCFEKTDIKEEDVLSQERTSTPSITEIENFSKIPCCMITIKEEVSLTVGVMPASLKHNYDRLSKRLDETDASRLKRDLTDAYCRIVESAIHVGCSVLPFFIRYRYLDREGKVLYVSPAKYVSGGTHANFFDELSCRVIDAQRQSFDLHATGFSLQLITPQRNEEWCRKVAMLIVEATPFLPVVTPKGGRVENSFDADAGILRFFMPGVSVDMQTDNLCESNRALKTLEFFDELAIPLFRLDDPFGVNAGFSIDIPVIDLLEGRSPDVHADKIKLRLESLSPNKETCAEQRIFSLPNRFFSECGTCNGDTILWASPILLRWHGWNIQEWTLETAPEEAWQGCCIVEMADGEQRAVWSGSGDGNAPLTLTPVWHYPSEEAVAMEVRVRTPHGTAIHRESLKAIPGRGLAVSHPTSPEKISLNYVQENYSVPLDTLVPVECRNILLTAPATHPLDVKSALKHDIGDVLVVKAAGTTNSVWDFARHRFYVFSSKGIYLVVVNNSNKISVVQPLDKRSVANASHVATDVHNHCVTAYIDGSLWRIKGTEAKIFTPNVPSCKSIACNEGETWVQTRRDEAIIYGGSKTVPYKRSIPPSTALYGSARYGLIVMGEEGNLYRLTTHREQKTAVVWHRIFEVKNQSLDRIIIDMNCSQIRGKIELYGHTTDPSSSHDAFVNDGNLSLNRGGYFLNGAVRSRLSLPLILGRVRYLTVRLVAEVSADARFSNMYIK